LQQIGEAQMDRPENPHLIRDTAALERLYASPSETAIAKEIDYIHPHYRKLIEASPFAILGTVGPGGLDCSPRGDRPGFVHVEDERTLLLPDRRGNNRLDSLKNILADPRVALLFLIPGVEETMRVKGKAEISTDPALLARFAFDGKLPRTVIVIRVERAYFQCARALLRSELWNPDKRVARKQLPSTGEILAALTAGKIGGADYDRAAPQRLREGMY
jgi:uncharacterized protein